MSEQQALDLFIAFAAGSIPFGWIIAKLWGVGDLRKVGSSNIGATNVVRTAGWVPGALTFLLDFAKSIVPMVYLPEATIWVGLLAVIGHCYSPFLRFRGGKGVSTTLGAVVAFNPAIGIASILIYAVALGLTRVSALGSLFAMLTSLAGTLIFTPATEGKLAVGIMVLLVLGRHRDNWNKLLTSVVAVALLASGLAVAPARADVLKDFRGKVVEATRTPQRVVALIPSLAETVIELGAGPLLIGAPEYTRLPKTLKHVRSLGPYNRISPEVVYAAHPDLVLASMDGNDASTVEKLEQLGLKVVTVNTQSLSDISRSLRLVAASLGDSANRKVTRFHKTLFSEKKASRPKPARVFVQIGWEPLVSISQATFIDELVRLAGGANIFADSPVKYPRPNPEEVIARNPDVIVICQLTDSGDEASRARSFWMQFKRLSAVKNGKVYTMPVDWLTKPGLNLLNGLRELRRMI